MSFSIKLKLLSVIDKLVKIASKTELVKKILEEFPEAAARSALLTLFNERDKLVLYFGFDGREPVVKEVDVKSPPFATTEITMHVNTFVALLKQKIDFWTAYLHDLIDVKTNDGLPPSYHVLLWGAFFDRLFKEVLG
jgi:hypothetical protein